MSPNRDTGRPRILAKVGLALLAASCAVVILLSAVAKVRDAADRTH
jgi:hypothetical protein